MDEAKTAARDDELGKVLRGQIVRWQEGKQIDEYLAALEERISKLSGERGHDAEAWLGWARNYRSRLDPLTGHVGLPADCEFTGAELAPFMPRR
jgi:hypothetical protein